MPFAILVLLVITVPTTRPQAAVLPPTAATILTPAPTKSDACREIPSDQSSWKGMLQAADAKLCTTTIVPE